MAACAKHFPGDGVDDLDQHTVTSVNTLSRQQWHRISGFPFRQAIEAGVWSVMVGHIALPAWDDTQNVCGVYRPASISHKVVTGLLRGELDFQGLIVTDDMNMGGVAGYAKRRERTVACIAAGCDMLLFPKLPDDYATLVEAVRAGTLPEARVDDAVRRILAFKARLNLHTGALFGPAVPAQEQQAFADASRQIAARAIVKVRDIHGTLPIRHLQPGAKVLTITLASDSQEVPEVDRALRARGYDVDHAYNPDDLRLSDQTFAYDAVFVNFVFKGMWGVQSDALWALTTVSLLAVFIATTPASSLPRSVRRIICGCSTHCRTTSTSTPPARTASWPRCRYGLGKPSREAPARSHIWCVPMLCYNHVLSVALLDILQMIL